MSEKKGLSSGAYGGIDGKDYVPYIPATQAMPEMTAVSIFMGILFAVIFGAANTYLGLKIGMTIAAGIPAAILSTGILKGIFRRNNILESNMIQAMASMGESLAGGLIFIMPAVILLGNKLTITSILIVSILGGLLGILFVVPLRKYLTVEEHGRLLYPEGMAASEVLVSGSAGGVGLKTMLSGLAMGGAYKFLSGGLLLWSEDPMWTIKPFEGTMFGANILASLVGVGYIVGIEIGMYMFAGALVAWFGLIPLIKYFGAGLAAPLFPSVDLISKMDATAIWSKYIRYIGAGAVAFGGVVSIIKALPTIGKSFKSALGGVDLKNASQKRTDIDVPMVWVIGGAVFVFVLAWLLPISGTRVGVVGALLAVLFAFFFAVVSARLVGIIGTSNNPISGMTIATLMVITAALKASGYIGNSGMIAAIIASSIVCVATAVGGGVAQSLKTTYIIGGTPKKLQIGMFVGIATSAAAIGAVIMLLDQAYGLGSKAIAAPQANMMAMVVSGIMSSKLPWTLVIIGVAFGAMCELLKIPVLPFALGLYLPIDLSTGVLIGGIVRVIVDKKFKKNDTLLKKQTEKGILLASGLVAGDALVGILVAVFAILGIDKAMGIGARFATSITGSNWTAAVMVILLCVWMYRSIVKVDKE